MMLVSDGLVCVCRLNEELLVLVWAQLVASMLPCTVLVVLTERLSSNLLKLDMMILLELKIIRTCIIQ